MLAGLFPFKALIEQNLSVYSSKMKGNLKGSSPAFSLSEVTSFSSFSKINVEKNLFCHSNFLFNLMNACIFEKISNDLIH